MERIINWKKLNHIVDGCGGVIYNIINVKNSELKKVETAMCIFAPAEIAKLHYHKKMEEIYFIIDGEGEIELDGKWYPVKSEDSISIPPGVKHRMKNSSNDKSLKFLSVNSPEWEESDMISIDDN